MTETGADAVPLGAPLRAAARRAAAARPLLVAFVLAGAVDLVSLLAGWHPGHLVAKPLLMPLLAGHVYARGGPKLLVAALLCGWGGDVFLLSGADAAFLLGMGCFAAGHVCYLVLFGRGRTHPGLGAAYGIALVATVAALWPDLPAGLRIPVAGYSLLLTAMAYRSSRLGPLVGVGGALFLLSDTLIATGVADWPQLPRPDFWIMLTYVGAQALLAQAYREESRTT
ncbi:lysoplasmalogenase [Streptomyces sp. NBC_00083]|uniref:lysoplasmalogenase n=1 Tax=Streptomyces sp. NBC_00083 TaxID=2975647 RepID=UPI0022504D11|nr:lysoplasmalogenase [Streptomyces sp. NBC_00083]MCX5383229.1 lysoplasmalogenase [Streptomyces sp. NBC_00083]